MFFWRLLIRILSAKELRKANITYRKINMNKLKKNEPALILMNHSNFLDMKIAHRVLFPRCFNIVATTDGFVGRNWLMREIGCIPTVKFISDPGLVKNIMSAIKKKRSVLMYPECGYSVDGRSTTLPYSLAKLVKVLKVPLVTIITDGVYLRQPLYGNLYKRNVSVSADVKYVLSKDEIASLSVDEIYDIILEEFSFNGFEKQINSKIEVTEPLRAKDLNKVLYKCPVCLEEGKMEAKTDTICCTGCNNKYYLSVTGKLIPSNKDLKVMNVPKWIDFEREAVLKEINDGTYHLDTDVDVIVMKDTYHLYKVGSGHLTHGMDGFHLTLDDGTLDYHHPSTTSYSVNIDLHWYQIGDLVCVGDYNTQYYCFPKQKDVVIKTRFACEEIYKIVTKDMK